VATVADILGNRIRIHFDGWTDDFDYWTDITSTNIHPVRWCENNGRSLSPPSGYNCNLLFLIIIKYMHIYTSFN